MILETRAEVAYTVDIVRYPGGQGIQNLLILSFDTGGGYDSAAFWSLCKSSKESKLLTTHALRTRWAEPEVSEDAERARKSATSGAGTVDMVFSGERKMDSEERRMVLGRTDGRRWCSVRLCPIPDGALKDSTMRTLLSIP